MPRTRSSLFTIGRPPTSTLSPSPTLFRSRAKRRPDLALFGIVQGSVYPALRERCARAVAALDLPGNAVGGVSVGEPGGDRKSTRLNSSHSSISYAVFCLNKESTVCTDRVW